MSVAALATALVALGAVVAGDTETAGASLAGAEAVEASPASVGAVRCVVTCLRGAATRTRRRPDGLGAA